MTALALISIVIAIIVLTGGIVGARLWATHRVYGFLLGVFVALVVSDVGIRLILKKSLSLHLQLLVDAYKKNRAVAQKSHPWFAECRYWGLYLL